MKLLNGCSAAYSLLLGIWLLSCRPAHYLPVPHTSADGGQVTGSQFYHQAASLQVMARDSLALHYLQRGNLPAFLHRLYPVSFAYRDSMGGSHHVTIWVTPDYLSIGTAKDWARIPLTPATAQRIADQYDCFLPSPALADHIYQAAKVKLEPVPLSAFRDSTPVFWQHHLIIEGQRKGRSGLIAGIKKDVVRSTRYLEGGKSNRVVIYGWHRLDGSPIQPVYAGHVDWYVDYSHGIRLISRSLQVDGKWRRFEELTDDPLLRPILCDGVPCMTTYPLHIAQPPNR